MGKITFTSIYEYIAAQPAPAQRVLERVRSTIRKAVPEAEEKISYNIPTLKLNGRTLLHFAGWKNFVSVYPANSRLVAEFGDEIAPYLVEKSTLRFPLDEPLPLKLIERIATFRASEIAGGSTGGRRRGP
jgi:uncharacterized protein YdhG (YjbR/CyaY superfamily)